MTRLRQGYGAAGPFIAAIAAVALAAFGVVKGTWAVGGSDSSCYALMAQAFAAGDLQPSSSVAIDAPWPDAQRTLAPGGFFPSPVRPDAASPICAPGMSVLMAPLAAVFGRDGIFWLVPLSGAVLVWSAFLTARRLAGGIAGATAAILTAASPIILFQVVQPMNDVLAAALWVAAFALVINKPKGLSPPVLAGILIGMAILVRPNLAPVAVVIALAPFILKWPQPARATALMLAAALPGIVLLLWLNQRLYGSVIGSGYGDAAQLFSVSHINQNLSNFGRAFLDTQYLVPLLGLAAPVVLLVVLASATGVELASRARIGGVVPIAAVWLAILGTRAAGERQAFELQRLEGRYRDTAALVRERLPETAVLVTVWQSGSVRFHADRQAVMWDTLDPAWLDRAVAWLQQRGQHPYFLFERREELEFRSRFRGPSIYGGLDWPPRIDLNRQVRIYDPADRARFLAGETYPTDNQPRRK